MQHDAIPITMDEWQEALRKEVERNRLITASIGSWQGNKGNISTRENLFRGILDPRMQPRGNFNKTRQRDPNAMDVDRIQTSSQDLHPKFPYKCFNCGKEGHVAQECQNPKVQWMPRTNTGQNQPRPGGSSMSRFFLSYYLAYGLMLSPRTFHLVSLSQRLNPCSSY